MGVRDAGRKATRPGSPQRAAWDNMTTQQRRWIYEQRVQESYQNALSRYGK